MCPQGTSIKFFYMKRIFAICIILISVSSVAQDFCERRINGAEFFGSSSLVPIGDKIYHFYSVAPTGLENRTTYFVKADPCLNVLDSVKVPLDSGLYRNMYEAKRVKDKIYGIAQISDILVYDPAVVKYKYELFVYDTTLVLQNRVNLATALGQFNFRPELYVLGDSMLMITSAPRSSNIKTAFTFLDLQGNRLSQHLVDSLYLYANPAGTLSSGTGFIVNYGEVNYNFSVSPFQIISIDTFTTSFQQNYERIYAIRGVLSHPNGDTYMIGMCDCHRFGNVLVYRLDSIGNQKGNVIFGSNAVGSSREGDAVGHDGVTAIATNGDLVIATYRSKTNDPSDFEKLVITRLDEDLNEKWEKIISIHRTSFIPIASAATPDNGATFVSMTTDSTTPFPLEIYNDLHYLHIDSTGYYSPLSTEDFDNMLNAAVNIYPNPVSTTFTLENLQPNKTYQAGIYDVNGKQVERLELSYPFEVNVGSLPSGSYLLDLQDSKGSRITKKFVKE